MRKFLLGVVGVVAACAASLLCLTTAYALQSSNYRFTESALGGI